MVVSLDRAVKRNEWIVVTTWSPHWMFARYPVRYLADPKGSFGADEAVHAVARKGFEADFPKAAAFLKKFKLTIPELEALGNEVHLWRWLFLGFAVLMGIDLLGRYRLLPLWRLI